MKKSDVFQSTTLKADDFQIGDTFTGKITSVEKVTYTRDGKDEDRVVAMLSGQELGLQINKTNWEFIEDALMLPDSDDWTGAFLKVECQWTKMMGKKVHGLRVIAAAFPKGKGAGPNIHATPKPPEVKKPTINEEADDPNDECPF